MLNRITEKQDLVELCKNQADTCKEYVCKMRKHEVFDPCMGNCEKSCLTQYALKCAPECVPSCICEAGYVREGGQCIPVVQCVDRIFDYRVYKDKEIVTFPPNKRIYPYFPKLRFTFKTEKHDSNKAVATTKRRFKTATFESLLNAAWKKHQQIEKLKYYSS
ncbi:uncharacterized protein LOC123302941 [Chrysoperla carnea]|uniref:uncharacterized protein LOC123302941 n=1 Tax=Chrysoperla carnea TaxID=189513 RepID=UPI001D081581|nr:uncharacterized protein LOC123302941 [Chrysoperla carnea]